MSEHGNTPVSLVQRSRQRKRRGPRGVATLWVIVSIPFLVIFLCVVVEIGNIWLARVELENAVEAAALATVQEWKATLDTDQGRTRGRTIGLANCVRGVSVALDLNNMGAGVNDNLSCDGDIVLGTISGAGVIVFDADATPGSGIFGVRVNKSAQVPLVCCNLLGISVGPFNVTARTYASCVGTSPPRLLRVDQYICDTVVRDPCD